MELIPLNCNVLVKPDQVEEKIGSIILSEQSVESRKHMQTCGEIVAVAGDAFMDVNTGAPLPEAPGVGSRVYYGKYAAKEFDKDAGLVIVKDVDVTAVLA